MRLAELLEREAGHILVGFALMLLGAGFWALSVPKSEDSMIAGITIIARALMGNGNGKGKDAGKPNAS